MTTSADERALFYERFAGEFDERMHPAEVGRRLEFVFAEALTEGLGGKTFLDAGCGTGLFSSAAVERGALVTSLDVGPKLLERVAQKCDSERVVGDLMELPFEDGRFDVVLCTEVLEHTPDPARAIAELVRVTRARGTLVITTPNRNWRPAIALTARLGLRPYEGVENWMSFDELEAALRAAGVSRMTVGGLNAVPLGWRPAQRLLRWAERAGPARRLMVNMFAIAQR